MADDAQDDQNPEHCDSFEPIDRLSSTTMKRRPQMELNKTDLLRLLSYLEGELQGRDITIAALKAEKTRNLVHQAKYGRFGLEDPLLALQRDHTAQKDASPANEERAAVDGMYQSQMKQLDNLIETQKKAQFKMREQLKSVEKRYHKVCAELEDEKRKHAQDTAQGDDVTYLLEKERERLKNELEFEKSKSHRLEKEVRKLNTMLSETNTKAEKNKHVALLLLKERKQLMEAVARLAEDNYLVGGSESTSLSSSWHEERLQLRARIEREENRSKNLQSEIEQLKSVLVNSQTSTSNVISSKLPIKVSSNRPTPPQTPPAERRRLSPQDSINSSNRSPISSKPTADFAQNRANTTMQNIAPRPQAFASAISSNQASLSPVNKGKKPVPPVRTSTLSTQPPPVPPNKPVGRNAPIRTFQSPSDRYQTAENSKRETKNGPQANERESGMQSDLSFLDQNIQDFQKTYGSLQDINISEDAAALKSALINGSLGDLHMILNNSDIDVSESFLDCNLGPLHFASIYGHTECLRVLLERSPESIDVLTNDENSALHFSASRNHPKACKLLLEKSIDLIFCQNKASIESNSFEAFENIILCISSSIRGSHALFIKDEHSASVAEIAARSNETKWLTKILENMYLDLYKIREDQSLYSIASENNKQYVLNFNKLFRTVLVQVSYCQTKDDICKIYLGDLLILSQLFRKAEDIWLRYINHIETVENSLDLTAHAIKYCSIGSTKFSKSTSSEVRVRLSDILGTNEVPILTVQLEEGSSFTLSYATLMPIRVVDEWLSKLEKKKHLILISSKNSGKKFCCQKIALVFQARLHRTSAVQIHFISDTNNNENEIYLQLISTGALIERNSKRLNERSHRIIVFSADNSACANVFSAISHFLYKRGSENCVRLKLTEQEAAEYFMPPTCYFIISFDIFRYKNIFPSIKHNLQTFFLQPSEEPLFSIVSRFWNKKLLKTFNMKTWICASWIISVYQNLNNATKRLGLENVQFGPTKFFLADIEPGAIWSTSEWLVSTWNKTFVPYISRNVDKNMIETALNVLIQRALLPQCPLESEEKELFIRKLEGNKAKEKRERRSNERRISTPVNRHTPVSKIARPYSAGDRKLVSPFRPVQYPSENF
ncbi:DgyrCDS4275 [Dimorphilus gyrociliatus]|uniref:Cortactin-binding protein 2 n=1 Tax=Dimorphilus gyrociliatus TaxID=2664684 RepID=A0A7I8VG06_9ANNE|nr:DgyrCDS4275 [Dimorphilus gyrociliatus]